MHTFKIRNSGFTKTAVFLLLCPWAFPANAFSFMQGYIYSTSDNAVNEYDQSGQFVDSVTSLGIGLRGLAFGQDNHLYVVQDDAVNGTARVNVLNSDGALQNSFAFGGSLSGNISYGKIAFDPTGQQYYVGTGTGVYQFDIGSAASQLIIGGGAFDISVLPSGGLVVASDYAIGNYSSAGSLVSSFSTLSDPNQLSGLTTVSLTNIRGFEYDAKTNTSYLTMLGYTGNLFDLIKLDGLSNTLSGLQHFNYGDDLAITRDGRLIVGSRTLAPGIFSSDLQSVGQLQGNSAMFVTSYSAVPVPSAFVLMLSGCLALFSGKIKRSLFA